MILTESGPSSRVLGPVQPRNGDRFAAWLADLTWATLYPAGRDLYYQGEHRDEFTAAIREEFGFDPSADPQWGRQVEADSSGSCLTSYAFHCPARHIDAIYGRYGSHQFPGQVRILHD